MWTEWLERTLRKGPAEREARAARSGAFYCHCEEPDAAPQSAEDGFALLAAAAEACAEEV